MQRRRKLSIIIEGDSSYIPFGYTFKHDMSLCDSNYSETLTKQF